MFGSFFILHISEQSVLLSGWSLFFLSMTWDQKYALNSIVILNSQDKRNDQTKSKTKRIYDNRTSVVCICFAFTCYDLSYCCERFLGHNRYLRCCCYGSYWWSSFFDGWWCCSTTTRARIRSHPMMPYSLVRSTSFWDRCASSMSLFVTIAVPLDYQFL